MVREFTKQPAMLPLYIKALLKRCQSGYIAGDRLPNLQLRQAVTAINGSQLLAYRQVSGLGKSDQLPVLFPQIMAFPLQMALLTDRDMPFPVMGLVHLTNEAELLVPISTGDQLALSCSLGSQQVTASGICFEVLTQAHNQQQKLVWRGSAAMLYRCRTQAIAAVNSDTVRRQPKADDSPRRWRLAADTGRRYARLSRDLNPIHLFSLSAKLFGFNRHIAHGMCMASRCLADAEAQLPAPPYRVSTQFKRPVSLPSTVALHRLCESDNHSAELWSENYDALHLVSEVRKLPLQEALKT